MAAVKKPLTPKQQRFVEEYLVDLIATQAAIRAGYKARTANQAGHKLLAMPHVAAAIAAKREKLARKAEVTVESLAEEYEQVRLAGMTEKQLSAAATAITGKAKLYGLIVDRHKHSGAVGSYDLSRISDADLEKLERILGSASAEPGGDPGGEATTPS